MDRKEFDDLEYIEQVNYVNSELSKGGSLRSISEGLPISKTTIRDRFAEKVSYFYDKELRQYCKSNTSASQQAKSIKKPLPGNKPIKKESLKKDSTKELLKYEKDILELAKHKSSIFEMLKNYKNNDEVIETHQEYKSNTKVLPQININELPDEMQKTIVNKSFKMYKEVYDLFNEVCSQYQGIKKQDLISLAIFEFCNKYNKK